MRKREGWLSHLSLGSPTAQRVLSHRRVSGKSSSEMLATISRKAWKNSTLQIRDLPTTGNSIPIRRFAAAGQVGEVWLVPFPEQSLGTHTPPQERFPARSLHGRLTEEQQGAWRTPALQGRLLQLAVPCWNLACLQFKKDRQQLPSLTYWGVDPENVEASGCGADTRYCTETRPVS